MTPKIFQIGTIVFITAASSFGLSLLLPKGGVNHLLAIKQPEHNLTKMTVGGSASAQTVTPAANQIVEIPKVFQGQTIYAANLKPSDKVVALTFDDGPGPKNTAQILEILHKNNIKATFFMVGEMVQYHPQVAKQVVAGGHVLGNHTWHHWYHRMDTATAASEINRTADIIYKTTGVKTNLFRPPGGFLNNGLVAYAKNQKYAVMMWSAESGDSQRRGQAPTLVNNVLKRTKPGGIVLLHDGGGNRSRTVKALPDIITGLKAQGYQFVTIPQLLEMQAKEGVSAVTTDESANNQPHHH
jgi:peptidoglycan/xylan/chitin deacetylase (PgdA/CDA1 family)